MILSVASKVGNGMLLWLPQKSTPPTLGVTLEIFNLTVSPCLKYMTEVDENFLL